MRVESLSSRLDFDERRGRSLESVVEYRPPQPARQPQTPNPTAAPPSQPPQGGSARQDPRADGARAQNGRPQAGRPDVARVEAPKPDGPPAEGGRLDAEGERRRRRRRRRRRPGRPWPTGKAPADRPAVRMATTLETVPRARVKTATPPMPAPGQTKAAMSTRRHRRVSLRLPSRASQRPRPTRGWGPAPMNQ